MSQAKRDARELRDIAAIILARAKFRFSHDALCDLAGRLEASEAETATRLAHAGQMAAEAQTLADDLRKRLAAAEKNAAANENYKRVAAEAQRLTGELARDLAKQRENTRLALAALVEVTTIAEDQLDAAEVKFQYTAAPGGLAPNEASDLAVALELDAGNADEIK